MCEYCKYCGAALFFAADIGELTIEHRHHPVYGSWIERHVVCQDCIEETENELLNSIIDAEVLFEEYIKLEKG